MSRNALSIYSDVFIVTSICWYSLYTAHYPTHTVRVVGITTYTPTPDPISGLGVGVYAFMYYFPILRNCLLMGAQYLTCR